MSMQQTAEELGQRVNAALRGEPIDVSVLRREWNGMKLVYTMSEAHSERAAAVAVWASQRNDACTAAMLAVFVPNLWGELIVAALLHDYRVGFSAVWCIMNYGTHARFIAATGRSAQVVPRLASFLRKDQGYLRLLLMAVPVEDDATFAAVLEHIQVTGNDLRFAHSSAARRAIVSRFYATCN